MEVCTGVLQRLSWCTILALLIYYLNLSLEFSIVTLSYIFICTVAIEYDLFSVKIVDESISNGCFVRYVAQDLVTLIGKSSAIIDAYFGVQMFVFSVN